MSLSRNFRLAVATARSIKNSSEMLFEDMQNAETEDDLFAVKTRGENIKRLIARLEEINVASLEGRSFEE